MTRDQTMHRSQAERDAVGAVFGEADVGGCYAARPPYAPALHDFLLEKVSGRTRAMDLGCGPGKIAQALADSFEEVVALDPSGAMIAAGRAADAGRHPNIRWVTALAEDYQDAGRFDLIAAGTAIHWPDQAVLFPKLADWTSTVAIITGDAPVRAPCGEAAWTAFLTRWLARVAERTGIVIPYSPERFAAEGRRHEAWIDIAGRRTFAFTFDQSVEDFITCQHSRATWSRAVMGPRLSAEFDQELDALMGPFAVDGRLSLAMESELTWGVPLRIADPGTPV